MTTDAATMTTTERVDANRIGLRAVRAILDAATPMQMLIEGTAIDISVERLPPAPWPAGGPKGLDEQEDGPLPRAVQLRCTWAGGCTELLISVGWWFVRGYLVGIHTRVASTGDQIGWVSVAEPLLRQYDGESAPIPYSFKVKKRGEEDDDKTFRLYNLPLKVAVYRSGLPLVSRWDVKAFSVALPGGAIEPSPEEAFRRLVHVALLKLPFFVRGDQKGIEGDPPFDIAKLVDAVSNESIVEEAVLVEPDARRASIRALPGGVRQYKETTDALLNIVKERSRSKEEFFDVLRDQYEVNGESARLGYLYMLVHPGLLEIKNGRLDLAAGGEAYLENPTAQALFEALHRTYSGLLEVLVIASALGRADTQHTSELLSGLLGTGWKTNHQTSYRRNWLLSLGATERRDDGDVLTELGAKILDDHAAEVGSIRARLVELVNERGTDEAKDDDDDVEPDVPIGVAGGVAIRSKAAAVAPPAWDADRLDLTADLAGLHTALKLPKLLLEQACAALSAGKHLLLVGPPGTGKTELALSLVEAARADGYCTGAFVATASADWTTFDTIGGYALQKDGSLAFRSGAFLRAVEKWQWLLIDELNRADVDRAFGELMTVLGGRGTDTTLVREDGRLVGIGQDPNLTHYVPRTFRLIATMNTWDKTSLFRLSYAVQRRFAVLHIGVPDDATYAHLLTVHATREGVEAPLSPESVEPLKRLFQSTGLFIYRAIGPAVALDMIRYMRRRRASGDALAEAIAMYMLPQLEGLEQEPASKVLQLLCAALTDWTSAEAILELRGRYKELFPHLTFAET